MQSNDPMIDTVYDSRYRIRRKLGAGGMADVYLADDETLGRQVAIKVLNQRFAGDDAFVERFLREASSAARLNHPNIVQVYDRGQAAGTYYIAMEFVDGSTLKDLIRDRGSMSETEVLGYSRQALNALRFAHRNGIVHRDIKPHNMMVDGEGRLKIADFGIARAGSDTGLTEVGSIVGTAQYLSPEQAQGKVVSASSDLYSMGVCMFEMTTGQVPFDGDSPVNVALRHVNEQPVRPSMLKRGVTPALEGIILRALQKDPARRYDTADEMLADVESARHGTVASETAALTAVLPTEPRTQVTPMVPPVMPMEASSSYARSQDWGDEPPYDEDEAAEEEGRRWWPWLLAALLALLLAGGAWALLANQAGPVADDPAETQARTVEVPDVTGQARREAAQTLRGAGLVVASSDQRQASDDAPAGTVIGQDPDAGDKVDRGTEVTLTVSTGPEQVTMPDVIGDSQAAAVEEIVAAGFERPGEPETEFSDQPAGTVLRQTPQPGEEVDPDTDVLLVVSRGPEMATVPSLIGLSEDEARAELEGAGLEPNVTRADSSQPAGTVIGQRPGADRSVVKGSAVTISVSNGQVSVPNITGLSPDEAEDALDDAGLEGSPTEQPDPTMDPGEEPTVTRQSPSAGSKATAGSTVSYTVATPVAEDPA